MDIFVSNLPFEITEEEITQAFAKFGEVSGIKMVCDKATGKFRGIAFVTMEDKTQAFEAMDTLRGTQLGGREIFVEVSRPHRERFSGFGGGFEKRPNTRFGFRPRKNFSRPERNHQDAERASESIANNDDDFVSRKKFGGGLKGGRKNFGDFKKRTGFKKRFNRNSNSEDGFWHKGDSSKFKKSRRDFERFED